MCSPHTNYNISTTIIALGASMTAGKIGHINFGVTDKPDGPDQWTKSFLCVSTIIFDEGQIYHEQPIPIVSASRTLVYVKLIS